MWFEHTKYIINMAGGGLAGKEVSAHEVSVRCSQLQIAWQKCADMVGVLSVECPEQAVAVNRYFTAQSKITAWIAPVCFKLPGVQSTWAESQKA